MATVRYTPSKEEALWNLARECAYKRKMRRCQHAFGDPSCATCDLCILNYGDYKFSDAKLLMKQAEGSVMEALHEESWFKSLPFQVIFYTIIIFVALFVLGWLVSGLQKILVDTSFPEQSAPSAVTEHANIERSLWLVDDGLRAREDVNKDRLVNCIDAALIFYRGYPDESKVQIVQNKRPDGKMNHLFNAVYTNGTWIYIEPQAYFKNWYPYNKYLMKDIWGSVYNPIYNSDQTLRWRTYLRDE